MPIIIFSALCAYGSVWFIEQKETVQWICEKQNLDAQKSLVEGMQELLSLNPKIQALVLEKKWVQAALKLPTVADKPALTARLIMINVELTALLARQKGIIFLTHGKAGHELASLKRELHTHITKMGRQWRTSLQLHFHSSRPRLRLRKKKIDSIGYLYLEHPLLTEQQKINVTIAITGEQLFPRWMTWLNSENPLHWRETCLSKPEKENTQWLAKLHLDRF